METPFESKIDLQNVDPEMMSFIYQTIYNFEPFTTPTTVIAVVAKDPLKLAPQLEAEGLEIDRNELSKLYRISISLTEEGTTIEEEGLHEDIYTAILIAKNRLLKVLEEIQDNVISAQDRKLQINAAMESSGTLH